jgi:hypothetical protein
VGLGPLATLKTLEELTVTNDRFCRMTPACIAEVRALGHLRTCRLVPYQNNAAVMAHILALPHTIQWQDIECINSKDVIPLLAALPSLTVFRGSNATFSETSFVSLPNVRHFTLFENANVCPLLDTAHHVTQLDIYIMSASLDWARSSLLCRSLRMLTLVFHVASARLNRVNLHHLYSLKELHHLTFDGHTGCESSAEFIALHPPSVDLPALQTLTYTSDTGYRVVVKR